MGIISKIFILIMALKFGCFNIQDTKTISNDIIGNWVSDKALYHNIMFVEFDADGTYVELVKNTKTKKLFTKIKGQFNFLNDSTVRITSKNKLTAKIQRDYYIITFYNKRTIRFYLTTSDFKESAPILIAYTFVKMPTK